jgi:hypothetical protein
VLTRNVAWYEARMVFGAASLLPTLLLPAYGLLGWVVWVSQNTTPLPGEVHNAFVFILPLGSALAAAHLMTIEREEGFDALRRSYPEPPWRIPLIRSAEAVLLMVLSTVISCLIFGYMFDELDLGQIALPALAPALYLTGLALLINNFAGNYWVSAASVTAYWYVEMQSMGDYTGSLFLFNPVAPRPGLDPNVNQALLVATAALWLGLNIGYSVWRRRQAFG